MHLRHYRPATSLYLISPGSPPPEGRGACLRLGREMPADPREYARFSIERCIVSMAST